jgi:hypothetical protein
MYRYQHKDPFLYSSFISIIIALFFISIVIMTKGLSQTQDIRSRATGEPYNTSPVACLCQGNQGSCPSRYILSITDNQCVIHSSTKCLETCSSPTATRHCKTIYTPPPPQALHTVEHVEAQTGCFNYDLCYQKCQATVGSCSNVLTWSDCSTIYGPTRAPTLIPTPTGYAKSGSCSPTCSTNQCSGLNTQICKYTLSGPQWGDCSNLCRIGTRQACRMTHNGLVENGYQICDQPIKKNQYENCDMGYWGLCRTSSTM